MTETTEPNMGMTEKPGNAATRQRRDSQGRDRKEGVAAHLNRACALASTQRRLTLVLLGSAMMSVAGCASLRDPNVPSAVQTVMEPESSRNYLLYKPSYYDRDKQWPLVIVCSGSGMFDSPSGEMRRWTRAAETQGFFVATVTIESSSRSWGSEPEDSGDKVRRNEQHILAVVRHIQAAHHISEDRVFIYGWSQGANDTLYAGMGNPQIFRAICVAQPYINQGDLGVIATRIDVHQPILVRYAPTDAVLGQRAADALKWLREHHGDVVDDRGSVRDGVQERVVDFFEYVVSTKPWVQVRTTAADTGDPLAVKFRACCSFKPEAYEWVFDEEATSLLASPTHVFPQRGVYAVQLTVYPPKGKPIQRMVNVAVPSLD